MNVFSVPCMVWIASRRILQSNTSLPHVAPLTPSLPEPNDSATSVFARTTSLGCNHDRMVPSRGKVLKVSRDKITQLKG